MGFEFPNELFLWMFFMFRVGSVYFIQTAFVPDEYWQSLEVAHRWIFGYGHMTWEWKKGIRSSAYPLFIALQYKILQWLKWDTVTTVVYVPRVVQAILSCLGDYYTVRLSKKLHGYDSCCWTALCLLCSWFIHYTASRTLTNVIEQVITAVALNYYPWGGLKQESSSWRYIVFVGLACLMRPTACILWFPLIALQFSRCLHGRIYLLKRFLAVGAVIFTASVLLDTWFYGHFVITPWRFLKFNWYYNIGAHYGVQPWHWYFTQGLPAVLAVEMVPFFLGMRLGRCRILVGVIIWHMLVLSTVSHKEFRFLLPVMPLVMCICGEGITRLPRFWKKVLIVVLVLAFFPMVLYFGLYHQRGSLDLMDHLAKHASRNKEDSVLFLTPCHTTPLYSHLHRDLPVKYLTCLPNFHGVRHYKDEADEFFLDPQRYLDHHVKHRLLPKYIVFYDIMLKNMSDFLIEFDYSFKKRFVYTHFPSGNVGKDLWLYEHMY